MEQGNGFKAAGEVVGTSLIAGLLSGYAMRQRALRATGDPQQANHIGTRYGLGTFFTLIGALGTPLLALFEYAAIAAAGDYADESSKVGPVPALIVAVPLILAIAALVGGIYLLRESKRQLNAAVTTQQIPPAIPSAPSSQWPRV